MDIPQKGEIWQHYKTKGEYEIIDIATMQSKVESLDMQQCVIYLAPNNGLWVRPLVDFVENIIDEEGGSTHRFKKIR